MRNEDAGPRRKHSAQKSEPQLHQRQSNHRPVVREAVRFNQSDSMQTPYQRRQNMLCTSLQRQACPEWSTSCTRSTWTC